MSLDLDAELQLEIKITKKKMAERMADILPKAIDDIRRLGPNSRVIKEILEAVYLCGCSDAAERILTEIKNRELAGLQ
jgi:hypothetical protein